MQHTSPYKKYGSFICLFEDFKLPLTNSRKEDKDLRLFCPETTNDTQATEAVSSRATCRSSRYSDDKQSDPLGP